MAKLTPEQLNSFYELPSSTCGADLSFSFQRMLYDTLDGAPTPQNVCVGLLNNQVIAAKKTLDTVVETLKRDNDSYYDYLDKARREGNVTLEDVLESEGFPANATEYPAYIDTMVNPQSASKAEITESFLSSTFGNPKVKTFDDFYTELYDNAYFCNDLLTPETRTELGEGYANYCKEQQSEVVPPVFMQEMDMEVPADLFEPSVEELIIDDEPIVVTPESPIEVEDVEPLVVEDVQEIVNEDVQPIVEDEVQKTSMDATKPSVSSRVTETETPKKTPRSERPLPDLPEGSDGLDVFDEFVM